MMEEELMTKLLTPHPKTHEQRDHHTWGCWLASLVITHQKHGKDVDERKGKAEGTEVGLSPSFDSMTKSEPDAAPNSRCAGQLPASSEIKTPDSQRTSSSGG